MTKRKIKQLHPPLPLDFEPQPQELLRFLRKVKVVGPIGCWEWQGALDVDGYGRFRYRYNSSGYAHRWAWAVFRRPLPAGLTVHHACRNTRCCNPWHLSLMPNVDNVALGNRDRNKKPEVPF